MTTLTLEYCGPLAEFIASAIEVGTESEDHGETEVAAAMRLSDKLRECEKGVRITVEPVE